MAGFPRTTVGGLSVSRMIIGSNWFLGWSHQGSSQDQLIHDVLPDAHAVAAIIEVFLKAGVDTCMAPFNHSTASRLLKGIEEAEQRTGIHCIKVDTPTINVANTSEGYAEAAAIIENSAKLGCEICMPHHSVVEVLLDREMKKIRRLGDYTKLIREHGMIPGLSAHMPEVVMYADSNTEDVETYIQIYNSLGFLMQIEVEFIQKLIHHAKKPVMTIKPMAAGRLTPLVGLNFVWNTLRECDMVTVGTLTPREATECIEISLAAIERRLPDIEGRASPGRGTIINK